MKAPAGIALLALAACRPTTAPVDPEPAADEESAEPAPLEPETPTNRNEGERLEAAVPLMGGGALDLASLEGQVVLLEISASTEPSWSEAHAHYGTLRERHGQQLAVVVVANDEDPSALEDEAVGPIVMGWDPMGALAARLRLAGFPTVIVLDRKGNITLIRRGFDEDIAAELDAEIERLLAS